MVDPEAVLVSKLNVAGRLLCLFESVVTLSESDSCRIVGNSIAVLPCRYCKLVRRSNILVIDIDLFDNDSSFLVACVDSISDRDLAVAVFIIVSLDSVNLECVGRTVDNDLGLLQSMLLVIHADIFYRLIVLVKIILFNYLKGNGSCNHLILNCAGGVRIIVGCLAESILSGSKTELSEGRACELLGTRPALNYLAGLVKYFDICAFDFVGACDIGLVDAHIGCAAGHILIEKVPLTGVIVDIAVGNEPSGGGTLYEALGILVRHKEYTGRYIKDNVFGGS